MVIGVRLMEAVSDGESTCNDDADDADDEGVSE